jgi:hypothetical protein
MDTELFKLNKKIKKVTEIEILNKDTSTKVNQKE